jgi:HK97 family phage prohead protease
MTTAAAERRAASVAQRSHRPQQRRAGEHGPANVVRASGCRLALRDNGDAAGSLRFTGHAAVYGVAYEMWDFFGSYQEIVAPGAAAQSLAREDLDVPLVLDHESIRRIARTTNDTLLLSEDDTGLRVDAPALDPADADVAYIAPKIRAGLISEMSFMFRIEAGAWSPDYSTYTIGRFDIHRGDVSIVGFGANPHTDTDLRAQRQRSRLRARIALATAGA